MSITQAPGQATTYSVELTGPQSSQLDQSKVPAFLSKRLAEAEQSSGKFEVEVNKISGGMRVKVDVCLNGLNIGTFSAPFNCDTGLYELPIS